jgi:hypothetical protein
VAYQRLNADETPDPSCGMAASSEKADRALMTEIVGDYFLAEEEQ